MEEFKLSERRVWCAKYISDSSGNISKYEIIQHLVKNKIPRRTASKYASDYLNNVSFRRKEGSGMSKITLTRSESSKLDRMIKNKVFPGYRVIARKFNIDHKTAKRIVQEKGYVIKSRKKCPKSHPGQEQRQKTRLRKLRDFSKDFIFVMDDESYFDLDGHDFFGGDRFAFKDLKNVPDEVRYIRKRKYGPKLMVWIAISEFGHSNP